MNTGLKFSILVSAFFLGMLLATGARSQSAPARAVAEKSNSPAPVAILAGRLIDVRTGHVTTNAYIVVEKDRIARIDTAATAGMKLIDLSKYTVVPGLIDCHAHLLGNPKDQALWLGCACPPAKRPSGACTT